MARKIFINYRREDTQQDADALYDYLEKKAGRKQVFMDIDAISPGQNFIEVIKTEMQKADVILMLIGPKWEKSIHTRAKAGQEDYVLQEIDWALASGKTIIPVLFYRDALPDYGQLQSVPYGSRLPQLAPINAVRISRDYRKTGYQKIAAAAGLGKPIKQLPKRMLWPVIAGIIVLTAVFLWQPWQSKAPGVREKKTWQTAEEAGQLADYRHYLDIYPDGKYAKKARKNIQKLRKRYKLPEMVKLTGGTFPMGQPDPDIGGEGYTSNEQPVHKVSVADFFMGKHEVTYAQYIAFMNDIGVKKDGSYNGNECVDMDDEDCAIGYNNQTFYFKMSRHAEHESCPVTEVTRYGARAYGNWLSRKTGYTYRLPTEAEWEYAAGGGAENRTRWGGTNNADKLLNYAWYKRNSGGKTHRVGQKNPNAAGLYDMSGNVWEWCSDWYSSEYYSKSPRNNPRGPDTGSTGVARGGSYSEPSRSCRIANRNIISPGGSSDNLSLRIVREP